MPIVFHYAKVPYLVLNPRCTMAQGPGAMDQSIDGDEPASATIPATPYHLAGASKEQSPVLRVVY